MNTIDATTAALTNDITDVLRNIFADRATVCVKSTNGCIARIEIYLRVGTSARPDAVVEIESSGLMQITDDGLILGSAHSFLRGVGECYRSATLPLAGRISLDVSDARAASMIGLAGTVYSPGHVMEPWAAIVFAGHYSGPTGTDVDIGDPTDRPVAASGEIG